MMLCEPPYTHRLTRCSTFSFSFSLSLSHSSLPLDEAPCHAELPDHRTCLLAAPMLRLWVNLIYVPARSTHTDPRRFTAHHAVHHPLARRMHTNTCTVRSLSHASYHFSNISHVPRPLFAPTPRSAHLGRPHTRDTMTGHRQTPRPSQPHVLQMTSMSRSNGPRCIVVHLLEASRQPQQRAGPGLQGR